jgi:S-adenosylmethionine hydrolase
MAVITLLTDFGSRDAYVGIMKGVILGINPAVRLVDLTHEVGSGDIAGGGFILASAWRWFPPGAVHLAVVDPGVGSERRPLVIRAGDHWFVGPDNGLFTAVLDTAGEVSVRELTEEAWRLTPVSRTFHGRDIFAPAAAWLSRGVSGEEMGPPLEQPVRAAWLPEAARGAGGLTRGVVLHVDVFGNLITNITREEVERKSSGGGPLALEWDGGRATRLVGAFAEGSDGEPVMLIGSAGFLEVAVNRGSAAEVTGVQRGDEVRLRRARRTRTH